MSFVCRNRFFYGYVISLCLFKGKTNEKKLKTIITIILLSLLGIVFCKGRRDICFLCVVNVSKICFRSLWIFPLDFTKLLLYCSALIFDLLLFHVVWFDYLKENFWILKYVLNSFFLSHVLVHDWNVDY